MRNVILQEFVTLDGFAAGPRDSVDFVPASTQNDQSFGKQQLRFIDSIDAMLLGRVTYQMFAGYWPKVTSGEDKPFADKLNALQKIVFSKTLKRAPWGKWGDARIVKRGAAAEVAKLKRETGRNMIVWGSISLAQSLINAGLIDEYRLVVCPFVLGEGRLLFGDEVDARDMRLIKAKSFERGAVQLTYEPANRRSPRKSRQKR